MYLQKNHGLILMTIFPAPTCIMLLVSAAGVSLKSITESTGGSLSVPALTIPTSSARSATADLSRKFLKLFSCLGGGEFWVV
jgi:hypothetical protein